MTTEVQSVIFRVSNRGLIPYTPRSAELWLKGHGFKPIKPVHIVKDDRTSRVLSLRYRLHDPEKFRRFRTEHITRDISLIIGFK
jgi:hypothetical protein